MYYPILPPELIDYILSFLRKDSRTLCACACVCKDWLPISRAHLFASITFKTPHVYTAFVEQVTGSLCMHKHLEHVRGMAIVSPDGFVNQYLADKFLRDMHGHLPNLCVLRISRVDWGHLVTSDTYRLLDAGAPSPFPRLTKLAITRAVFPSESVLTRLIVSLPSLTNLSLRKLSFRWYLGEPLAVMDDESAPHRSTALETLWVDGSAEFATPFLAWFVEQFPELSVSLRELGCTPTQWFPVTASMIDALRPAPALRTLLMPFPKGRSDTSSPVSLAHLTNLSRLNVLLMPGQYPSAASWTDFGRMLGSLAERDRTGVSSLSVALCYYPAKLSDWLLIDGPGLALIDPVLVRLAEAFTQSSVSLPAYLPRQGILRDRSADSERRPPSRSGPAAFKFKFVCYVHQPRGSRVTTSDVDRLVKGKLEVSSMLGVVAGRLMHTLPGPVEN